MKDIHYVFVGAFSFFHKVLTKVQLNKSKVFAILTVVKK